MPLYPGKATFARFFSPAWWTHVWIFSRVFARQLIVPSILFGIGSLLANCVLNILHELSLQPQGQAIDTAVYLPKMATGLFCTSAFGLLYLIAMILLFFRLTIFTRAFAILPPPTRGTTFDPEYTGRVKGAMTQAASEMNHHKAYLAKCTLLAALISLPVSLSFTIASFFAVATTDPNVATTMPMVKDLALPIQIGTGILFIILSNYSITTVALACALNRTVGACTKDSFILFFTSAPALTLMTLFTTTVSTIISTPTLLIGAISKSASLALTSNMTMQTGWEVWQVLTGFVVYPVCTALLFEIMRDQAVAMPPEADRLPGARPAARAQ